MREERMFKIFSGSNNKERGVKQKPKCSIIITIAKQIPQCRFIEFGIFDAKPKCTDQ
jgi:hypothetical protein